MSLAFDSRPAAGAVRTRKLRLPRMSTTNGARVLCENPGSRVKLRSMGIKVRLDLNDDTP